MKDQALTSLRERLIEVIKKKSHVYASKHPKKYNPQPAFGVIYWPTCAGAHGRAVQSEMHLHGQRVGRRGGISPQTTAGQRHGAQTHPEEHGSVERTNCYSAGVHVWRGFDRWTGKVRCHIESSAMSDFFFFQALKMFLLFFRCKNRLKRNRWAVFDILNNSLV